MANSFRFGIYDGNGAPVTGGAASCVVTAYNARTLASRTAPVVTEPLPYVYSVTPTDADELTGTAIIVDTGAGRSQRYKVLCAYRPSSQFFAWVLLNSSGAMWNGAAPTLTWSGATTPTITSPATGIYVAVPSSADITAGAYGLVTSHANSYPAYLTLGTDTPVAAASATAAGGLQPELLAVDALKTWLLRQLPAKVAAINAARFASVSSALVEPFNLAGEALTVSVVGLDDASPVALTLPTGTGLTAAEVAFALEAQSPSGFGATAVEGRLVLTSDAAPAAGAPSVLAVLAGAANETFGWSPTGEMTKREPLVAPSWRGIMDGVPLPSQELGTGFWVIIGDRTAQLVTGNRRSEYLVSIHLDVMRSLGMKQTPFRDREAIGACVRAVREVLTDDATGRQLGRAEAGDVVFAEIPRTAISGQALQAPASRGSFFFDVAAMEVSVRINNPATGP